MNEVNLSEVVENNSIDVKVSNNDEKMFCIKCGLQLPENCIFCPKCGHEVNEETQVSLIKKVKINTQN